MRKADNLPPSCVVVTKSGNLNFLESFGLVQSCNGTALPLLLYGRHLEMIWTGTAVLADNKLHHCEHPANVLVADARLEISAYADIVST